MEESRGWPKTPHVTHQTHITHSHLREVKSKEDLQTKLLQVEKCPHRHTDANTW